MATLTCKPYITMHSFVLSLEGKYVFGTFRPGFAIVWVDVCHDMSHTIFVVADSLGICVEITSPIVLSEEVPVISESVVTMEGDDELNIIVSGTVHEVVQPIQHLVVERERTVSLQTGKALEGCAFLGRVLTYDM